MVHQGHSLVSDVQQDAIILYVYICINKFLYIWYIQNRIYQNY
jgi:hypothetical protein